MNEKIGLGLLIFRPFSAYISSCVFVPRICQWEQAIGLHIFIFSVLYKVEQYLHPIATYQWQVYREGNFAFRSSGYNYS